MTAAGEHCLEVNDEGRHEECGSPAATRIDPAFAGRYLRVVDRRYGSGSVFAGVGHSAYYPIGPIEPAATVAVAVVGRIAPAVRPPQVECGPLPLTEASISGDGSARIVCQLLACRATLLGSRGGRKVRIGRTLPPTSIGIISPVRLRFAPASLRRLRGGPVKAVLKLNGRVVVRRTVRIGPLPVVAEYPSP